MGDTVENLGLHFRTVASLIESATLSLGKITPAGQSFY
jgi:hypothetical protein